MFFVFILAIIVLAFIGLGSVLGAGAAGIGALFLLPIIFLKLTFFLFLFGFVGRHFYRGPRRPGDWSEPRWQWRARPEPRSPSNEERFEEWHRMAHAREEVDGWVSELDEIEQE